MECWGCDRPIHPEAVECPFCGTEISIRSALLGIIPWAAGAAVPLAGIYLLIVH